MFDLFHRRDPALDASLLEAAEKGDAGKIEELLHQGASPNAQNPANSRTAAHIAARAGRLDILKILREHKADLNLDDADGDIPLDMAIVAGHLDTVQGLFDMGVKANNPELRNGYDPVYRAAHAGNANILKLLHEKGCAIDKEISVYTRKEDFDVTPLHAAAMGNRLDCIQALLELGADVNKGSVPPVFWAVRYRHSEAMEILLNAGCFVTQKVLAEAKRLPHSQMLVQRLEVARTSNPPSWSYHFKMWAVRPTVSFINFINHLLGWFRRF